MSRAPTLLTRTDEGPSARAPGRWNVGSRVDASARERCAGGVERTLSFQSIVCCPGGPEFGLSWSDGPAGQPDSNAPFWCRRYAHRAGLTRLQKSGWSAYLNSGPSRKALRGAPPYSSTGHSRGCNAHFLSLFLNSLGRREKVSRAHRLSPPLPRSTTIECSTSTTQERDGCTSWSFTSSNLQMAERRSSNIEFT